MSWYLVSSHHTVHYHTYKAQVCSVTMFSVSTFSCYFYCYRKSLCSKHSIVVKFESEDVTEDIITRKGSVGSVTITVSNTGMVHYQVLEIFMLCELIEIEEILPVLPLHLKPGTTQNFRGELWFSEDQVQVYCTRV